MYPRPRKTKLVAKKRGILNEVFRSEGCSRFELARRLNINATMVGAYVSEFLEEEVLVEGEPVQSRPGRAPIPLEPNPRYGCFLGVDIEALRVRAVLCDFAGGWLEQEVVELTSTADREDVLKAGLSLARRVAARADRELLSVGLATLPELDQWPVQERFQGVFDVPVFVEEKGRAMAYAELLRGVGRGSRDFLCLTVGSDVWLGVVVNGSLYRGSNGLAGGVGYMVMEREEGPKAVTDLVSAAGFVESTRVLLGEWRRTEARQRLLDKGDALKLRDLVEAAEGGDRLLQGSLEQLGERLGMVVANLVNLFAPEKVLLAGEVPGCCRGVRQALEGTFRKHARPQVLESTQLEDGSLGVFAGALGVAWMGFARIFPEDEDVILQQVRAGEEAAQSPGGRNVSAEG